MHTYFLSEENSVNFLDSLSREYRLFLPEKQPGKRLACEFGVKTPVDDYCLKHSPAIKKEDFLFNEYRTIEPIKTFFSSPKEIVSASLDPHSNSAEEKIAIFGVKNCDLFSLKIQDYVFLEGVVKDPLYEKRRNNTLLISGDCTDFKEVCFCLALEIMPFAEADFDFNFSPLTAGFLVDVGSKRAEEIIKKNKHYFSPATNAQTAARDKKRQALMAKLNQHLSLHKIPSKDIIPDIVRSNLEADLWKESVLNCVECGGCNFICDTCHCFLLSDERLGKVNEKIRSWDACLYSNFARVAGGANPLKHRHQRLRNRYLKKFDFFPANIDLCACCGCGRCVEVCPAKIDIREILRKLSELDLAKKK